MQSRSQAWCFDVYRLPTRLMTAMFPVVSVVLLHMAPAFGAVASPVMPDAQVMNSAAATLKAAPLNGIWFRTQGAENTFKDGIEMPPYNLEWTKKNNEIQKRRLAGQSIDDPSLRCIPFGMPRVMISATYPFEILVTPGQITLIQELDSEVRRIFLNQEHPPVEELDSTYEGHSVGRWDGDTLVIDTIAIRSETPIDRLYYPRSEEMHVVERWRLRDLNTLEVEITLHDQVALVRPWSDIKTFARQSGEYIHEYICAENNERVQPLVSE